MFKIIMLILSVLLIGCGIFTYPKYDPDPVLIEYPVNLSWAHIDTNGDDLYEDYTTSIKFQPCGDCFIYAAIGLLEIQFQIDHKIQMNLDLSEQNVHNCLRIPCNTGGSDYTILEHLQTSGALEERYSKTGEWGPCGSCPVHPAEEITFYYPGKITEVLSVFTPINKRRYEIVKALQTGPITFSVDSWPGLRMEDNIIYCKEENIGGHVVIVVGYESHGRILIIKNSHGGGQFLKLLFDNDNDITKCNLGTVGYQISPNTTYSMPSLESRFCNSTLDYDGDGIVNPKDNCPLEYNKNQSNMDNDIFGDVCDFCPNDAANPINCE